MCCGTAIHWRVGRALWMGYILPTGAYSWRFELQVISGSMVKKLSSEAFLGVNSRSWEAGGMPLVSRL